MNAKDYLTNTTKELQTLGCGIKKRYHTYYHRECNIAIGVWVAGALIEPKYFIVPVGLIAGDIVARAIQGNHGREPASGLAGLVRQRFQKSE